MADFAPVNTAIDTIGVRINQNNSRITTAFDQMTGAITDLNQLQASHAQFVTIVDDEIAAIEARGGTQPTDAAWYAAQSQLANLVPEFLALKTRAEAIKAAMDAV